MTSKKSEFGMLGMLWLFQGNYNIIEFLSVTVVEGVVFKKNHQRKLNVYCKLIIVNWFYKIVNKTGC